MKGLLALLSASAVAGTLAGCATAPTAPPVEVARFHYDPVATRGTVAIEAAPDATAGPEFQDYAAAVTAELARAGYAPAASGARAENVAVVGFTRTARPLPPRRSPVTIGLGGGGYSGGYGGGVGLGGGVSFPLGRNRPRDGVATELVVRIRRGADTIWEGRARSVSDPAAPGGASAAVAQRLAAALFTGFPGESGRTIQVP